MTFNTPNSHASTIEVIESLMAQLHMGIERKVFFEMFSRQLLKCFHFDRLCINLYDQESDMLTYFTDIEGTTVNSLSPIRHAESSNTVAGHVIATKKAVIINDFSEYFSAHGLNLFADVGLNSSIAFPFFFNNEIFATLHCSFSKQPDDLYDIASFVATLCPTIAICIRFILAQEELVMLKRTVRLEPYTPSGGNLFVYHSKVMHALMRKVDKVANLNIPVLIMGESGTGKTFLAQEIHKRSHRHDAQFVKVNCPSLSNTLFESELFGHTKGAFTGAETKRTGRIEMAHKGTLFLDEIGELSVDMQSKLLQVLEESSFERVGESISLSIDVRFIAATNVNIFEAIANAKFRKDLFHRLATCIVEMPPLRKHKEDIPILVSLLSRQTSIKHGVGLLSFNKKHFSILMDYDWPGNIRELRNVLTRLIIYNRYDKIIGTEDIYNALEETSHQSQLIMRNNVATDSESAYHVNNMANNHGNNHDNDMFTNEVTTLAEMEKKHIIYALQVTGGTIAGSKGAAALLGIPRSTLQHRMKKLGLVN